MTYAGINEGEKKPGYIGIAQKMAAEIITNFKPEDQAEMLGVIYTDVINYREQMITQAEKHLCYLKEQYEALKKRPI